MLGAMSGLVAAIAVLLTSAALAEEVPPSSAEQLAESPAVPAEPGDTAPAPCPVRETACAEDDEECDEDEGDEACEPPPPEEPPGPAPDEPRVVLPGECRHGLDLQPEGPFAVMVFCDEGVGTTIGIVLHAPDAVGGSGWRAENRFWQEREWARDVTSFLWDPERMVLYVGTSAVFGKGGLFRLDLGRRLVRRLVPSGTSNGHWSQFTVKIDRLDSETRRLHVTLIDELSDEVRERAVRLPD